MRIVFDAEADNLLDNVTKIHCLCYYDIDTKKSVSLTNEADMMELFFQDNLTIIGHNIKRYDIPLFKKILGIDLSRVRGIDTLGLSWYLYPRLKEHGLEAWGERLGVSKPQVEDWLNLDLETYVRRCEEDVKINTLLLFKQIDLLKRIYSTNLPDMDRIMDYLSYKLDCAAEQEEIKWKVDVEKCKENLAILVKEKLHRFNDLQSVMPDNIKYKYKERPAKMELKKGGNTVAAQEWFKLLEENNLPEYHLGAVRVVDKRTVGNPNSHAQLKAWLFSLGWEPDEYKLSTTKKGKISNVPQIGSIEREGELSQSVIDLIEDNPTLKHLEGYFILQHRIGLLTGFLESRDNNDFLVSSIGGFTNTLRMQHKKPIANLPTIPKKYWELVRGVLIAPDDEHVLCGSDMSKLEDNTKQHYMMFFDPEYVKVMRTPGFDAHIDMAIQAKHISYEEGEFYKWYDHRKEGKEYAYVEPNSSIVNRFSNHILEQPYPFEALIQLPEDLQAKIIKVIKPVRLKDKKTNFAAVYGAGPAKIAATAKTTLAEGKGLHTVYWVRNHSVKKVARAARVKTIDGQMWLYNPVSRFWYSLRNDKDRFSTLNQGTGVYCFDYWVRCSRKRGVRICCQYHDELVAPTKKGKEEETRTKLREAIKEVNEKIKLNIELSISIDFGHSYADIH